MEVHWFNGVARNSMDGVQDLSHLDQVAVIDAVTVATSTAKARDKGGACYRGVNDVVTAKRQIAVRFSTMEGELRRNSSEKCFHYGGIEFDAVAYDSCTRLRSLFSPCVVETVDPCST